MKKKLDHKDIRHEVLIFYEGGTVIKYMIIMLMKKEIILHLCHVNMKDTIYYNGVKQSYGKIIMN